MPQEQANLDVWVSLDAIEGATEKKNSNVRNEAAMNIDSVKTAYRRWSAVYDLIFGPVMNPGRKRIVHSMNCRRGDSVLEVGVGTGLSLPLYPADVKVTGIDISPEMLARARERVDHERLSQVDDILEMDAEQMNFADNRFDKVVAMYVVTVVPDPIRLVEEMRRVCKPGGEIFIVNHFRSNNPLLALLEGLLAPLSKLAGFRPDFDMEAFLNATNLEVVDVKKTNLFGYWKILRCRNDAKESKVIPFAQSRPAVAHGKS